ncbi:MAG: DUF861 domain-containing protein [Colwellia sp.]|nr:DUF861 domain-containing protein [Colwellia sp.]
MSEKNIIKLSQNPKGFGEVADELEESMFESVLPKQHTHSYFEDEALGLYIGVWDSTDMTETAAPYACDEFMFIIEGAAKIKNNKTGNIETIMAGESFVISQGYDCQWHQKGYLRKFYVIYQPQEIPEKPVTEHVVYITENSDIPWQETSDGHRKKMLYQNNNQGFTSGVWQSKAFTTGLINFPYHEFIYINNGSLICTDEMGIAHHFNGGDALFIPQGTRCAWQVKDQVSIHFTQIK